MTGSRGHAIAELIDELIPAVIDGKEQFGRARNIHATEYKKGGSGHANHRNREAIKHVL